MYDLDLFLGFLVDANLDSLLKNINPNVGKFFINNSSDYLHEISYKSRRYIGKFIGEMSSLEDLDLCYANMESIFRKLIPDYALSANPHLLIISSDTTNV